MKFGLRKRNYFGVKELFSEIFISKISGKMNLGIITKNYAADLEIGFPTKSILQPFEFTSSFRQRSC